MDLSRAGRVISQKYRLDRKLGQGGMGEVWVARHLQLDTDVAVKLLVTEHAHTPGTRARFEREAKAAAQVKSPHIVHVFDYGVDGDTPYLAMELLEGEDLEARLRSKGRLGVPETAALVGPVCKALRRIHEAGLVHRDLKPSNVFLARHDDEDHVKILDFGIAKTARSGDATTSGIVVGSPPYMSPEHVLAKKELDHRTDLWSLGVILFRALTGRLPFAAEVVTQLLVEICIAPVPRASSLVPALGPAADAFFDRALRREPDDRFQTAAEMSEAFATFARAHRASPRVAEQPMSLRTMGHAETVRLDEPAAAIGPSVMGLDGETSCPPPAALRASAPPKSPAPPAQGGDRSTRADAAERSAPAEKSDVVPESAPAEKSEPVVAESALADKSDIATESAPAGEVASADHESAPASQEAPSSAASEPVAASVTVAGQRVPPRREASLVPAIAIGVAAAALLVWAMSALSGSPSVAGSGSGSRPETASGPQMASSSATTGPSGTAGARSGSAGDTAPARSSSLPSSAGAESASARPRQVTSGDGPEPAKDVRSPPAETRTAPGDRPPPAAAATHEDHEMGDDSPPPPRTPPPATAPPPPPGPDAGAAKPREFW